jgi:molybdopterin/thiamine biosynthesis adenylyltransferase
MFRYIPQTIPQNIFVIGGGGTGSRLMPMLTQFMRSITRGQTPNGWLENPTIWVIDDDVVETKNLLRQNFIQNDVGKPKATVLAERYGRAYGVDVIPLVLRIDEDYKVYQAINEVLSAKEQSNPNRRGGSTYHTVMQNCMVIICVDSVEARRHILNNFVLEGQNNNSAGIFFIDAGNEDSFGQVSFFNPTIIYGNDAYDSLSESQKLPKMIGSTADIDFIPMNPTYYKDLVDTESTASCADLNQTLAINAMMATTIMGVVQNYYYRKPFNYTCIRLSLDGSNSTEYLTFGNTKRMGIPRYSGLDAWTYGTHKVTEKSGRTTRINFSRFCRYYPMLDLRTLMKTKIDADQAEIERQRREEARRLAQEAEERERKAKLEELKKAGKEASSKAKKSGTKVVVEKGELPSTPSPVTISVTSSIQDATTEATTTEAIIRTSVDPTQNGEAPSLSELLRTATAAPAGNPTPRRRATARAAVMENTTVEAPSAWIPEMDAEEQARRDARMAAAVESMRNVRR